MTPGRLIAITGPAAVGKSTVARALQAELSRGGELWLVVELDVFARSLSRNWIAVGERAGRYADRGFTYATAADSSVGLTLGPDARRVLAAFHRSTAAIARSGVPVICETIVYDPADWDDWSEALEAIPATWVKLAAPVAVLDAREQADPTRAFQGLARGMSARPPVGRFDIEADTSAEDTATIVRRVIEGLR
jgi:chloramphenicol 3-O phosphotransferase